MIKVGEMVPYTVFRCRVRDESIGGENPFTWKQVSTDHLFKGKRVVVFALPGAFTPTCSSTHVPGYNTHYDAIKACGVEEVYCLSVNDAFVMRQWGVHLQMETEDAADAAGNPLNPGNFKKVKMLPDGAALFTRGMGMSCTWTSERGFGKRSWRYSAVIDDYKVEKLFVESGAVVQNSGPDPFEVRVVGWCDQRVVTMLGTEPLSHPHVCAFCFLLGHGCQHDADVPAVEDGVNVVFIVHINNLASWLA